MGKEWPSVLGTPTENIYGGIFMVVIGSIALTIGIFNYICLGSEECDGSMRWLNEIFAQVMTIVGSLLLVFGVILLIIGVWLKQYKRKEGKD